MIQIDLSGKIALVTGASQGIGRTLAETLDRAGARIAINYFNDEKGINKKNAEELRDSLSNKAITVEADVRDEAAVAAMIDKIVEELGGLDILVNNAGIIRDKTLKKMSTEAWQAVINTNLTGTFNVCRAAAEQIGEGGRIVNFSSISGVMGFFGQANYAASKAGVIALTKVLSKELAKKKVRVNAVAPGVVLTEMGTSIPEEVREEMLKSIPLGRFGEQQEIADTVLFLTSDLASYITGQVIHINGGWLG